MVFARQSLKKMFKLSLMLTIEVCVPNNFFFDRQLVKVVWPQKLECVKYEVEVSSMFLWLLFGNTFKSFVHLYYWDSLPITMGLNSFRQIVMHERHQ